METLDLVLSRGRHPAFRRTAKTDSRYDQENADAAFARPGARRSGPAQSVRRGSAKSGVFIDPAWREPKANPKAYVSVGDETPRPLRHSERSNSWSAKFCSRKAGSSIYSGSSHQRTWVSISEPQL